ncbi:MAG: flagellar basal body P-ring formation chaperone FlgA [Cyanobacteria bacterium]|nr:flagellar basal body P-ring formation chaperone FlgA [Cyanobacteriota bacterium]
MFKPKIFPFINTVKRGDLKVAQWLLGSFILGGFALIPLESKAVVITERDIMPQVLQHVSEALDKHFGKHLSSDELSLTIMNIPGRNFNFPNTSDKKEIQIEIDSTLEKIYSNRVVVQVHMNSDSGESHFVGIPIKVGIFEPVWVVNTYIPAGRSLSKKDLRIEKKDISQSYAYLMTADKPVDILEARVNMQPNELLDNRKVNLPLAVRRNSDVRILVNCVNSGAIITLIGQALSDGHIGDVIRVKQRLNNDSARTKYYSAKIINKNQVQVDL